MFSTFLLGVCTGIFVGIWGYSLVDILKEDVNE